jgi:hypothetical protein
MNSADSSKNLRKAGFLFDFLRLRLRFFAGFRFVLLVFAMYLNQIIQCG